MKSLTLYIVILVAIGWFAVRWSHAERQRNAIESLVAMDTQIIYDNQWKRMRGISIPSSKPPGRKWMHPILGVDFFDSVPLVFAGENFSDVHVQYISKLRGLRNFQAEGSSLTDLGIRNLCNIRTLAHLNVSGSKITDRGAEHFEKLPKLEALQLWNTELTDNSVPHLSKLRKLESLDLGTSLISPEGIKTLKLALPKCKIQWSVREPSPKSDAAEHVDLLQKLLQLGLGAE